eukprot:Phypoly_transcript_03299.p1 GENE.Phypoly_transcript_03299~~Phypoly_transcript_03299.p1  ORF type:complete len:737 (+),score=104.43 Phypoly_transcript_03299:201-2411(+)
MMNPGTNSLPYEKSIKLTREQQKVAYIYGKHTNDELERAYHIGNFPTRPSNLFLKVYSDVLRSVQEHPQADIVSPDLMATSGIVPMTIDAPYDSLLLHYRDCIVNAEKEILFAAGFWKVGKATDIITKAFRELNRRVAERGGPKVLIKIIWGRPTFHHRKNTHKEKVKLAIPTPTECPFIDIETMDGNKMPLGAFHVKYLLVDRKMILLTSSNIQGKRNVEFVAHMEGKIVDSYYNLFQKQWGLEFVPPLYLTNVPAPPKSNFPFGKEVHGPCIFHSEHAEVPMLLCNKLPNSGFGRKAWDVPQNIAMLSAMYHAQRNIVIQTPDFNAKLAKNAVLDACKRGVQVTIMLSWVYNALKERIFQGGTNVHVIKKMYKKLMKVDCHRNLTVCFYVARSQIHPTKVHPNHTKYMAVDDELAIFGSGNMDTQSWHHSQEVNVAVNSPLLVKEWMDLFKISQNTHLYGVINPNLQESPLQQIDRMLAKNNTQPTHVGPETSPPPYINNNSNIVITQPNSEFTSNNLKQSGNNNFDKYYNTFRGIYNQSTDGLQNSGNGIPAPAPAPSITSGDFFAPQPGQTASAQPYATASQTTSPKLAMASGQTTSPKLAMASGQTTPKLAMASGQTISPKLAMASGQPTSPRSATGQPISPRMVTVQPTSPRLTTYQPMSPRMASVQPTSPRLAMASGQSPSRYVSQPTTALTRSAPLASPLIKQAPAMTSSPKVHFAPVPANSSGYAGY